MSYTHIDKFEVVNHGIDHAQYYQGCGTAATDFTECVTGCGSNLFEAFNDALNQLSEIGYVISQELENAYL